jgi:hypothetical protein
MVKATARVRDLTIAPRLVPGHTSEAHDHVYGLPGRLGRDGAVSGAESGLRRRLTAGAGRTAAYLHGNCIGAGIELPAFAARFAVPPLTTVAIDSGDLGARIAHPLLRVLSGGSADLVLVPDNVHVIERNST